MVKKCGIQPAQIARRNQRVLVSQPASPTAPITHPAEGPENENSTPEPEPASPSIAKCMARGRPKKPPEYPPPVGRLCRPAARFVVEVLAGVEHVRKAARPQRGPPRSATSIRASRRAAHRNPTPPTAPDPAPDPVPDATNGVMRFEVAVAQQHHPAQMVRGKSVRQV